MWFLGSFRMTVCVVGVVQTYLYDAGWVVVIVIPAFASPKHVVCSGLVPALRRALDCVRLPVRPGQSEIVMQPGSLMPS